MPALTCSLSLESANPCSLFDFKVDSAALRFHSMSEKIGRKLRIVRVYTISTEKDQTTANWVTDKDPKRFVDSDILDDMMLDFLGGQQLIQILLPEAHRPVNDKYILRDMSLSAVMVQVIPQVLHHPEVVSMIATCVIPSET
ncbi:hypothetical protein PVAG01_03785 [Phlyctema vagabunda]|uniref:Uncharacterized protein n=1 Tax=Phlyctema vagabunda TaxID=108571 RepID=A0ABR4PMD9_9HELO